MKILAVSDKIVEWIYSPNIRRLLSGTELAIGCGDLPLEYLEFIISALDIPAYYVQGNHSMPEHKPAMNGIYSSGSINLHLKVLRYKGFTFAGIEGSLKYNNGIYQYSQLEMWLNVAMLVPSLLRNQFRYHRYLNVLITHAPAWGIHDEADLPHQGVKAFRWLVQRFQPDYHLHGHVHFYRPDTVTESIFGRTKVINAYGYKEINLNYVN
jgi:Icc-related predicted phosphoesterase